MKREKELHLCQISSLNRQKAAAMHGKREITTYGSSSVCKRFKGSHTCCGVLEHSERRQSKLPTELATHSCEALCCPKRSM